LSCFKKAKIVCIESAGIQASIAGEKSAYISLQPLQKFKVKLNVYVENKEENFVTIQVKLAKTGPHAWPAERLYVLEEKGEFIPIYRIWDRWHQFKMEVPAVDSSYFICVAQDMQSNSRLVKEGNYTAVDSLSGMVISICKWYKGKEASLSIRFDDSHPRHLSKVIPILDRFGFKATFMINPGNSCFKKYRKEWEKVARTGKYEFANHTTKVNFLLLILEEEHYG